MASKTIVTAFINFSNDIKRETLNDIMISFEKNNLLTTDIKELLDSMINCVKTNKKIKKPPQKRFSGYHLFMKEHRSVVKEKNQGIKPQELTTIVSKAWKDVPEKEKKKLNERAMKMKQQYLEESINTDVNNQSSKKQKSTKEQKKKKKEVKKSPVSKKKKSK